MLRLRLDAAARQALLAVRARGRLQRGAAAARGVGEREHDVAELARSIALSRLLQLDAPGRDGARALERQVALVVEAEVEDARVGVGPAGGDRLDRRRVHQEARVFAVGRLRIGAAGVGVGADAVLEQRQRAVDVACAAAATPETVRLTVFERGGSSGRGSRRRAAPRSPRSGSGPWPSSSCSASGKSSRSEMCRVTSSARRSPSTCAGFQPPQVEQQPLAGEAGPSSGCPSRRTR